MFRPGDSDHTIIVCDAWQAGVHLLNALEPIKGIPMKKLLTAIAAAVFVGFPSLSWRRMLVTTQVLRFTVHGLRLEGDED